MTEHYDDLETRDPVRRESDHFQSLGPFLETVTNRFPGWAKHLDGHQTGSVISREDLAKLPVLRKPELMEAQASSPPFGGFCAFPAGGGSRVFASPGPVYEIQAPGPDPWRAARALFAAGFRSGDLVQNSFGYHLTPGAFILEEGARALGCNVIPAGVGNTEQQVEAALALRPAGFTGTPDFLKIMLDRALELGRSLDSFERALVSGGALFPGLRAEYTERGIAVTQAYATADAGIIAYESPGEEGLILDEHIILEIVRPGTDDPIPEGEVGEIVITVFNADAPLVRFGTGDLSAILSGTSPCGRTNTRIKGWMGRADQRTKVKGMFVDPKQVAAIVRAHLEVKKARLVITRDQDADAMKLMIESEGSDELSAAVAHTLKTETRMSGRVELVATGSLPNDGLVIADERDYSS